MVPQRERRQLAQSGHKVKTRRKIFSVHVFDTVTSLSTQSCGDLCGKVSRDINQKTADFKAAQL